MNTEAPSVHGKFTLFSNMSDWNPAEMIGTKPHTLASSLYSELITDYVWSKQRYDYGYKNVEPNRLMVNLAGTTYIDVRTDFNSFLPEKLPEKIQKKAINYYLKTLKKFISYAKSFKDVWFCRRIDIANHWIKTYPPANNKLN